MALCPFWISCEANVKQESAVTSVEDQGRFWSAYRKETTIDFGSYDAIRFVPP